MSRMGRGNTKRTYEQEAKIMKRRGYRFVVVFERGGPQYAQCLEDIGKVIRGEPRNKVLDVMSIGRFLLGRCDVFDIYMIEAKGYRHK
jgi:hypothetical protein